MAPAIQMKYTFLDPSPPDLTESGPFLSLHCILSHCLSSLPCFSLSDLPVVFWTCQGHPSLRFFAGAVPLPGISSPLLFRTWLVFIVQSSLKGTSNKDPAKDIPSSFTIYSIFLTFFSPNIFHYQKRPYLLMCLVCFSRSNVTSVRSRSFPCIYLGQWAFDR